MKIGCAYLDENDGPNALFLLGLLSIVVGFLIGGWFWSNIVYIGLGLIIAGIIYKLADRELTEGAFFAALLFGVIGAVIWIVIDTSRSRSRFEQQIQSQHVEQEDFNCGNCKWFGRGCPRKETLINAEPCIQFSKKW